MLHQVRVGKPSTTSMGNFEMWLFWMLKVRRDGGRDPVGRLRMWLLSRLSQNSLLKELKNLSGISRMSLKPTKKVFKVEVRLVYWIASNSDISFLKNGTKNKWWNVRQNRVLASFGTKSQTNKYVNLTSRGNTSGGRNCIIGRIVSALRQSFGLKNCPEKRGQKFVLCFEDEILRTDLWRTKFWGRIALEANQDEINVLMTWLSNKRPLAWLAYNLTTSSLLNNGCQGDLLYYCFYF